jgi:hypothetical protein
MGSQLETLCSEDVSGHHEVVAMPTPSTRSFSPDILLLHVKSLLLREKALRAGNPYEARHGECNIVHRIVLSAVLISLHPSGVPKVVLRQEQPSGSAFAST